MSGYLSGWPEATTPALDEFYHHYHGGSPSARPPHADCGADCPFPPYADPPGPRELQTQPGREAEAVTAAELAALREELAAVWPIPDISEPTDVAAWRAETRAAENEPEAG